MKVAVFNGAQDQVMVARGRADRLGRRPAKKTKLHTKSQEDHESTRHTHRVTFLHQ